MFTKPTPNSGPARDEDARVERELLPSLPIFAGLPEAELDAVAEATWTVELDQGEPVATEGDVVGEIAVLASGRRTASVVATSPMRLLAVFKRDVWGLERRAPEASRRLQAVLDGRR